MNRFGVAVVALSMLPSLAQARDTRFGASDIRTLFFIRTSEDRDEVHYGIHLDKDCIPIGKEPVYVYWRLIEKGPDVRLTRAASSWPPRHFESARHRRDQEA
jgi:hypothetical protein